MIKAGEFYYWGDPKHIVKAIHPDLSEYVDTFGPCWMVLMIKDSAVFPVHSHATGQRIYSASNKTLSLLPDADLLRLRLQGI